MYTEFGTFSNTSGDLMQVWIIKLTHSDEVILTHLLNWTYFCLCKMSMKESNFKYGWYTQLTSFFNLLKFRTKFSNICCGTFRKNAWKIRTPNLMKYQRNTIETLPSLYLFSTRGHTEVLTMNLLVTLDVWQLIHYSRKSTDSSLIC